MPAASMDAHPNHHGPTKGSWLTAGWRLAAGIVLALGVLLVWFALLRENQAFWLRAGDHPVGLRELVFRTYQPLLVVDMIALLGLSMTCGAREFGSGRFVRARALLLGMCWALLAASGFIACKNNVLNLIHGEPLHHHK